MMTVERQQQDRAVEFIVKLKKKIPLLLFYFCISKYRTDVTF